MKVLYATNMYPSDYKPFSGIFIKEQIEMLHKTFGLKYSIVTGGGSNNVEFELSGDSILDFTESNPFGDPSENY